LDNNDLLRRLRYALRCDDSHTSHLIKLGGGTVTTAQAARFRLKESDPEFTPCGADVVAYFLDGLILQNRGPRETKAPSPWPERSPDRSNAKPPEKVSVTSKSHNESSQNSGCALARMDNNVVLKQLRIALSLRSDDVHAILQAGGSAMSESEAGALFRKPEARNYRQCGDQVLRQFIAGLVKRRQQESEQQNSKG